MPEKSILEQLVESESSKLSFQEIYEQIADYQIEMGFDPSTYSDDRRMQVLRDYSVALMMEQAEVLDEVSWKPWRTYESQKPKPNKRKLALEWVDMLFFLIDQALTLELSSEELEAAFITKMKANVARIKSGYSKTQDV